jgi:hypothetical protein
VNYLVPFYVPFRNSLSFDLGDFNASEGWAEAFSYSGAVPGAVFECASFLAEFIANNFQGDLGAFDCWGSDFGFVATNQEDLSDINGATSFSLNAIQHKLVTFAEAKLLT